ncbi:hypothetical protein [Haematobacter massiliensis]|uniref:hypothetical protein n=1 Tax=Haematobacter massiliensis TaxID=195105 RepID=UPI0023F0376A|nr:hypothetical protein [Haematobacter massiliensis]
MSKTIVTFTRPWGRYNSGEVAGFHPAEAAQILGRFARLHSPGDSVPAVSPVALDEREERLNALAAQLATQQADIDRQRAELVGATEIEAEETEAEAAPAEPVEPGAPPKQGK